MKGLKIPLISVFPPLARQSGQMEYRRASVCGACKTLSLFISAFWQTPFDKLHRPSAFHFRFAVDTASLQFNWIEPSHFGNEPRVRIGSPRIA